MPEAHRLQEYFSQGCNQFREMVDHNPMSSVMLSFGVGLGVGVLLGSLLVPEHQPTMSERTRMMADELGNRIYDALAKSLPDTVGKFLKT